MANLQLPKFLHDLWSLGVLGTVILSPQGEYKSECFFPFLVRQPIFTSAFTVTSMFLSLLYLFMNRSLAILPTFSSEEDACSTLFT